ncbi:hypothetical protein SAMN05192575_101666 [Nocardioides alpinus]|uniref:Glycosyltransferase 2-like domain-containing protein n=1 Tax=Nocardioides alpinus TaxID=748909 RepID=A0A1I0W3Z6_9ACTN|nr:glycosyltransferase [Nocardioides alpinus]SFA83067.1 hypothetical protein SAMN05192575_101666 [Nocardioides alpinus]
MLTPGLSVVIPHYGDPGPTRALVASLAPQGAPIIVVDDASPEPLADIDGATVIRREVNAGFGATVNAGVAEVQTDLVAILNSDLVVTDDFLASYLAAARPFLPAVVAPRVVTYGHVGASTFTFPTWRHVLAQRVNVVGNRRTWGSVSKLIGEDRPDNPEQTYATDWVSGAAMLLPTEEFRAVGGFDERFHMYLEEVDLQKRLAARGVRAVYVGAVVAEHIGFASSAPSHRERWQLESWLNYAEKWGWKRRLRIAVEVSSLVNLITEVVRGLLGRETSPLRDWAARRALTRTVWSAHKRRDT